AWPRRALSSRASRASRSAISPRSTWCATRSSSASSSRTIGATRSSSSAASRPPAPRRKGDPMSIFFDAARSSGGALPHEAPSSRAASFNALMGRIAVDPRLVDTVITRSHPLLGVARRGQRFVLIAPASVWDRGREVLRPFTGRFSEGEAMLILLGRPAEPDLAQALNRGLGAITSADPDPDEI